jgi:hypothetical protein
VIVEEAVNIPPEIVPSLAGLTDQATAWLGLFSPATTAPKEAVPPGATVADVGLTVTEVTVVVVLPVVLPPPPQPLRTSDVNEMETMPRQNSLDA